LLGLANRTNFDLTTHSDNSNDSLEYKDPISNEKFIPYIVETSIGVERLLYAIIANSLVTEENDGEERDILQLPFELAPYKATVAPLTNKLDEQSMELFNELLTKDIGPIQYLKSGTIGKRYRKSDAIGTPFVITYDFDTLEDNKVTIRHRDSMKQERVSIEDIVTYINNAK
jgi:glycyl-tRNA synthetase